MARESILLETEATLPLVRVLAGALRGVLDEWGVPEGQRALLELALVEAATNVARHAYLERERGCVALVLGREAPYLYLSVRDSGHPFDPAALPELKEPDPEDPSTWPEGGMGIPIMRSVSEKLEYTSENGFNTLTLTVRMEET